MKKTFLILFTFIFLVGCSSDPSGEYRVGSSYSYFSSNGKVSFYQISSGIKSCNTNGKWKRDGENIYVSGLNNRNCSSMKKYNGKYIIDGKRLVGPR